MASRDPRVDAYIARAAPFAQPMLSRIREAVHAGCPNVEETMKWSVPFFDYKGTLCSMAAFKQHVRFGFWKSGLLKDAGFKDVPSMGSGKLTSVNELPSQATLVRLVKAAAKLNEDGVKRARPGTKKPPVRVPSFLSAALAKNKKAAAAFDKFPPSHKREYIEWLTSAKTDETRTRRLAAALQMIAEGKSRNWKYAR